MQPTIAPIPLSGKGFSGDRGGGRERLPVSRGQSSCDAGRGRLTGAAGFGEHRLPVGRHRRRSQRARGSTAAAPPPEPSAIPSRPRCRPPAPSRPSPGRPAACRRSTARGARPPSSPARPPAPRPRRSTSTAGRRSGSARRGSDVEGQLGHRSEAATPAPQGPEQVRILPLVDGPGPPVGGHDPDRRELVTGQPVGPGQDADPTAQGQSGDPDRGAGPTADRHPLGAELAVDVGQQCTRPDRGGHRSGVHRHGVQLREVDHQPGT